jgi:hypothetical protein
MAWESWQFSTEAVGIKVGYATTPGADVEIGSAVGTTMVRAKNTPPLPARAKNAVA